MPIGSFSVKAADKVERGFIIGTFWSGNFGQTAFILDADGDVVWWFTDRGATTSNGLGRARLSADNQDVWLVTGQGGAPVRRVSIDTLDYQSYAGTSSSHDIAAVSGDTMAYIGSPGKDCQGIIEINKAGETKAVFDSTGLVGTSTDEPCHANAVRYSEKEDVYVFSDRARDVVVVDRAGTIVWKLSEKVSGGHDSWGKYQHGVHLLDDSILIYANQGGGDQMHSQAIEYGLDGRVIREFTTRGGCDWFGDVQRLPGGNTLVNYSCNGIIQQVDPSDNVVLEIKVVADGSLNYFGYTEFRPNLYAAPSDIQE